MSYDGMFALVKGWFFFVLLSSLVFDYDAWYDSWALEQTGAHIIIKYVLCVPLQRTLVAEEPDAKLIDGFIFYIA